MSYHLGLLLRAANDRNKLYKSIPLNNFDGDLALEHFIIPFRGTKVNVFNILYSSVYERNIDDGDFELDEFNILDGKAVVEEKPPASSLSQSPDVKTSPDSEDQQSNEGDKEKKKDSMWNKLFGSIEDGADGAVSIEKPEMVLPFAVKLPKSNLTFEINVFSATDDKSLAPINKYQLLEADDDLSLFVSNCKPESVDIQFKIIDGYNEYQKTIRIHLAPFNKIESYCLDFGSDAIQVSRAEDNKRINLFKEFNRFAQASFKDLFNGIANQAGTIYGKENYFEKENIYQKNNIDLLYNNLVFVSKELEEIRNIEETLIKESIREPKLNDLVQFFSSKGLTPYSAEIRDAELLNTKKNVRVEEVKMFLEDSEKDNFRIELTKHFLKHAKALQKNLKLTFLEGEVNHDYIPIYTTCISKIAWVLLEDLRRSKREYMDFTILYPNSFNSVILTRMRNILHETFDSLLANEELTNLKGYEIHFLSESDAAFLGIIDRDNNKNLVLNDKPFVLLIDIGKGTVDVSLMKKEVSKNSKLGDQYNTIARKGSLKAGNFLTTHIFLDLLCFGYRKHKSEDRIRFIRSHLKSFNRDTVGGIEVSIIELIEKIKTRTNARKINGSKLTISEKGEGGGTNKLLYDFLEKVNRDGLAFDPNGAFYKSALNEITDKIIFDLNHIFNDLNIAAGKISVGFLSGRSFKDKNLQTQMESKLAKIGLDQKSVKLYDNKVHAVSIFNNTQGSLNSYNSIYENVIFTPNGKELHVASVGDLISCGVECNSTFYCLSNTFKSGNGVKINVIGDDFYKSSGVDKIKEKNNLVENSDLSFAGFPFWTTDLDLYKIDFSKCSYPEEAPPAKEPTKAKEPSLEEQPKIADNVDTGLPSQSLKDKNRLDYERSLKLDEEYLNED